ncbi:MAG: hypothetical protein ACFFDN_18275 [Candidatus Hodarchaeota archaeon]
MLEFRLYSEGSNKNPLWGLAFRHKYDVHKAIDSEIDKRPSQIDIEFPDGTIFTFGIIPSFWNECYEFVDAQVKDKLTGKRLRAVKPIKSLAIDKLGYDIKTKGECYIQI